MRWFIATVVLLAVSLSWSAAVDLMPSADRPYIGSSGSNSALSLALGYNGLGRLTSAIASRLPLLREEVRRGLVTPFAASRELLRLFHEGPSGSAE